MKVYFIEQIISFGDFESPGRSERVSDYFRNKEDAEKFMKENFPESDWNRDSWNTIYLTSTDLVIK